MFPADSKKVCKKKPFFLFQPSASKASARKSKSREYSRGSKLMNLWASHEHSCITRVLSVCETLITNRYIMTCTEIWQAVSGVFSPLFTLYHSVLSDPDIKWFNLPKLYHKICENRRGRSKSIRKQTMAGVRNKARVLSTTSNFMCTHNSYWLNGFTNTVKIMDATKNSEFILTLSVSKNGRTSLGLPMAAMRLCMEPSFLRPRVITANRGQRAWDYVWSELN